MERINTLAKEMRHLIFLGLIILVSIAQSCMTQSQMDCFEKEQLKVKNERMYDELRIAFKDTLDSWISKEIQPKRNLDSSFFELDKALICNSSRNKCIMFLLVERQVGTIMYSTKFIGCELDDNGSWNFYYRPYPTSYYSFLKKEDRPFEYMSKETYQSLVLDGLIKDCKISDEYLSGSLWFSNDRKKEHEHFLKDIP